MPLPEQWGISATEGRGRLVRAHGHKRAIGASFAWRRPSTREGAWSLRLVIAGLVLVPISATFVALTEVHVLGAVALLGVLSIVVGGAVAMSAIIRRGERSAFVLSTILPWTAAAFLLIGERAFPH